MYANYDLRDLNTLRLPAKAKAFATFASLSELTHLLDQAKQQQLPVKILGGGSNILLTQDIDALVLQSAMHNIELLEQNADYSLVAVDAGVNWHQWVLASIEYGHGLENLALIPGTVGAAPVQNIGAYGVEVGECIERVEGVRLDTHAKFVLTRADCQFAYRDSIFKQALAANFIITRVVFKLSRQFQPQLNYGPLANLQQPTAAELIAAVCAVRQSKLPDPAQIPNAGSFFKNPIVGAELAQQLLAQSPALPTYAQADGAVKLAAGWLIEQAGWKGRWLGNVRMHDQQALVLTTNGAATYADIVALCACVIADVKEKFQVELEPEPQPF